MYALLDKSQIKVGPRQYAVSFFQDYLDKNSISFELPFDYDQSESIIINSDIKIVKVSEPTVPAHNSLTEQLAGPYYDVTADPISGHYDVAPIAIDSIKNTLIALVAQERYKKEMSGFKMTVQGQEVHIGTDKEERATWHQILTVIGSDTIKFKFSSTVWMDLVLSDVEAVITALLGHVQGSFVWEAGIIARIEAAVSAEELILIKDEIVPVVNPVM